MISKDFYCNYSDNKVKVIFVIADTESAVKALEELDYIDGFYLTENGIRVEIAVQLIPEIVKKFSENNIAIYAVIPDINE